MHWFGLSVVNQKSVRYNKPNFQLSSYSKPLLTVPSAIHDGFQSTTSSKESIGSMFSGNVGFEVVLEFGPVRANRALKLGLFPALEFDVADQVTFGGVSSVTPPTSEPLHCQQSCKTPKLGKFFILKKTLQIQNFRHTRKKRMQGREANQMSEHSRHSRLFKKLLQY